MSHPVRKKQIRRAILETLELAKGYALESGTLQTHVNDLLRPPATCDEWKDSIDWLGLQEFIRMVPNDFDSTMRQWCITERGKTLLRSN
jgi:hypothetical protein